MNRKIIQLLYLLLISSAFPEKSSDEIQKKIDQEKDKMETLEVEILDLTEKIKARDLEGKTTADKLTNIGEKIGLAEELIETLKRDENKLSDLISKSKFEILEKEKELNQIKQKATNMIKYLYKNKNNSYLDVLIGSDNWNDLLYKLKYLEILSSKQKENNKKMNLAIQELDNDILSFTEKIINKKNIQMDKKKSLVELITTKEQNKIKLEHIEADKFNLKKDATKKKELLIQINKMLEELYVDKDSAKKREKELERIRKEKEKNIDINYFSKNKGKLSWPVSGTIISKFGEFERNGVKTTNIGIEIKTKKDAEVKSVYDGIVMEIGFNPYYGSFIWIDHGNGFSTIYANLNDNSIFVKKQEYVESEMVMGKVQNVENNSHGILNFMLWGSKGKDKEGNYILLNEDPEEWIK